MDPDGMIVSTEAYFALQLQDISVTSTDPAIIQAITIPKNADFTVEAWVQPDERTDLGEDAECCVVRQFGFWELGFMGDGRVFGKLIYSSKSSADPLQFTLISPDPVDVGGWLYISLTVSPIGQLSLYLAETLLAQSDKVPDPSWKPTNLPDKHLELGGTNFSGRIRNVIISNRCKQRYNDPNDPSKDVKDFADSM
jgi:hypothetical protein